MLHAWVLSKSYKAPNGHELPIAYSYGHNHPRFLKSWASGSLTSSCRAIRINRYNRTDI